MSVPLWAWIGFAALVLVMLTIDLLAHRKAHAPSFREAAIWSGVWVSLALVFAGVVWATMGGQAASEFTTAWLLEKSLSVDNLFVFALIFGYFAVPKAYQHRVLFYGVFGALIMRAVFLSLGVAIVSTFTVVLFAFAAILIWSAIKLMRGGDEDADPSKGFAVRMLKRIMPVADEYHGTKFFVRQAGKRVATPLLAVVVAIEAADLMFAVDSIPAVLAVSSDTFIIFTSNAFAILGLRALFFLLSGMLDKFHHLGKGLAVILAFIGVKLILQACHKMISTSIPEIPSVVSLIVIAVVLAGSVIWSLKTAPQPVDQPADQPVDGSGTKIPLQKAADENISGQDVENDEVGIDALTKEPRSAAPVGPRA